MSERWTPARVLEAQRAAILAGERYSGPSLYDISDPAWHEVERTDDADVQRLNGDPSHFDTCESCAEDRRLEQKETRIASRTKVSA